MVPLVVIKDNPVEYRGTVLRGEHICSEVQSRSADRRAWSVSRDDQIRDPA